MALKLFFISSKNTGEKRDIYIKSENITVKLGSDVIVLIKDIFLFLQNNETVYFKR